MRRLRTVVAVAVLALIVASCATAYAPRSATGGYVEKWRSPTELEVLFHHNDLMTVEEARDLAMRRAAELALEGGHRYFRVWGERLHRKKIVGPQHAAIQAQFLDDAEEGALDAVAVVRNTDALARGRLSGRAREHLQSFEPPSGSN